MIIILLVGALLGPFSLVIVTANFLVNVGIGHINQAEEKTPQMSEACDATSGPFR